MVQSTTPPEGLWNFDFVGGLSKVRYHARQWNKTLICQVCVSVCVFIYNLQKEKMRPCLIHVHSGPRLGLG